MQTHVQQHWILNALAEGSDEKNKTSAEACSQANDAEYVIATIDSTWGTDIANAISNKLIESTVSGTDVNAKFEELKSETDQSDRLIVNHEAALCRRYLRSSFLLYEIFQSRR